MKQELIEKIMDKLEGKMFCISPKHEESLVVYMEDVENILEELLTLPSIKVGQAVYLATSPEEPEIEPVQDKTLVQRANELIVGNEVERPQGVSTKKIERVNVGGGLI